MLINVPDYLLSINPYVPGKPLEELEREYGISNSIKLASNENPLGPSPKALQAIRNAAAGLHRYPDGSGYYLVNKLADYFDISPRHIILGNGSDEIISMLTRTLLQPGDEVILPKPSFLIYEIMVMADGATPVYVPLNGFDFDLEQMRQRITNRTRMIFLTNPNNPTGRIITQEAFESFLSKVPSNIVVVVDEAYIEFVRDPDCLQSLPYVRADKPVVILRTFSKAYGLAGLRVGYGIMPETIAELLNRIRLPFNVNLLAQTAACAALEDTEFLEKTLKTIHEGIDYLQDRLHELGIESFPTQSNFLLINVKQRADDVFEKMLRQGVIIRSMTSYGYPKFIRVNAGIPEENKRFIQAIQTCLG